MLPCLDCEWYLEIKIPQCIAFFKDESFGGSDIVFYSEFIFLMFSRRAFPQNTVYTSLSYSFLTQSISQSKHSNFNCIYTSICSFSQEGKDLLIPTANQLTFFCNDIFRGTDTHPTYSLHNWPHVLAQWRWPHAQPSHRQLPKQKVWNGDKDMLLNLLSVTRITASKLWSSQSVGLSEWHLLKLFSVTL